MSEKIKIITVEDELLVALSLELTLQDLGHDVLSNYTSAMEFINGFRAGFADIVIMDIHLKGEMTGAEAGKILAKISDIPIIYLTREAEGAQKKMAISDTNASYYLTKPFNRIELDTAINISIKKRFSNTPELPVFTEPLRPDSIFIKEGQSHRPIKISDLVYLKAEGSYCELYSRDRKYLYSENLSYFGERLAFSVNFVRIHRSYIVNADFIEKIRDNTIWVNGEPLPIGRSFREALLSRFRFLS